MDSLTHIVLGACIGEAVAGKKLGKKAMLLGAIAQSVPDIDFVTTFWLSDSKDIVAHRGITIHTFCCISHDVFGRAMPVFFPKNKTWLE